MSAVWCSYTGVVEQASGPSSPASSFSHSLLPAVQVAFLHWWANLGKVSKIQQGRFCWGQHSRQQQILGARWRKDAGEGVRDVDDQREATWSPGDCGGPGRCCQRMRCFWEAQATGTWWGSLGLELRRVPESFARALPEAWLWDEGWTSCSVSWFPASQTLLKGKADPWRPSFIQECPCLWTTPSVLTKLSLGLLVEYTVPMWFTSNQLPNMEFKKIVSIWDLWGHPGVNLGGLLPFVMAFTLQDVNSPEKPITEL